MFGEEEIIRAHRKRAQILVNLIVIAFGIVLARLWYLQIYRGDDLYQYSLKNRLRQEDVRAPRGMMFSRNEKLIVNNVPRFDAIVTPQYLQNKEETLKKLAKILGMEVKSIKKIIKRKRTLASYKPIIVKKNIGWEEVSMIETNNDELPGVSVDTFISREYLDSEIGAHLLGYISEINDQQLPKLRKRDNYNYRLGDFIGQFGLEERFDTVLRGENGYEFVEDDAFGRKKRDINDKIFKQILNKPSRPGKNVKLTIDQDMQKAAFEALEGKVGSVVAVDVNTGEILAMVSRPSFDPSQFSKGLTSEYWNSLVNNENKPMRDRTIQDHYSPGSTFKVFTAIAGLEEGIIDPRTKIRCHGTLKLGRRVYHSWKKYGREKVNVENALQQSCNIFFYTIGTKLDIDRLAHYAGLFGLGVKTGINLPREVSGLIPTKEWKLERTGVPWQVGETLSCSIGQSYVLTTVLQMATAYAAIANEGKRYRPYLVKEVFDNFGNVIKTSKPELVEEIKLKKSTWRAVKKGLYKVVNTPKGTAWWRRGSGIQMAGKTGTSQVIRASADKLYAKCEKQEYKYRHHGVFVGFAPYKNPKIAVASLVEHGCHGSSAAAPVVAKIAETYMAKYHPETYEKNKEIDKKITRRWLKLRELELEKKKAQEEAQAEESASVEVNEQPVENARAIGSEGEAL